MRRETLDPWLVSVKTTEVFVKTQALSQEILIQSVRRGAPKSAFLISRWSIQVVCVGQTEKYFLE